MRLNVLATVGQDDKTIRELAKAKNSTILISGRRVFEVSEYAKGVSVLPTDKWLLLNHYANGLPLAEAADKAHVDLSEAERFIETPQAVASLQRYAAIQAVKQKYAEGGEWLLVGDACLEGKKHLAKDQQIVFQAMGDRFMPKPKQDQGQGTTTINFNFSPESVKQAFERQRSIEAELA